MKIISGCINMTGVLKIRTTKEFGESTVSKILDLVEECQLARNQDPRILSPSLQSIYTPGSLLRRAGAGGSAAPGPACLRGMVPAWGDWIYRALTFLVISCPCALVISIPLSFFAGIGGASNAGVLVKGSNYLEALSQVKCVVFDKTGTLTQGVFEVSGVHHSPLDDAKLLEYAALAECASSHPISKSLQKAYGKPIDRSRVTDIQEISGQRCHAPKSTGTPVAGGQQQADAAGWTSPTMTATVLGRSSTWPSTGPTPGIS